MIFLIESCSRLYTPALHLTLSLLSLPTVHPIFTRMTSPTKKNRFDSIFIKLINASLSAYDISISSSVYIFHLLYGFLFFLDCYSFSPHCIFYVRYPSAACVCLYTRAMSIFCLKQIELTCNFFT